MGRTGWRGLLSSTLLLVLAAPAAGAVVTYSDQTAWRVAAGSYVMENFDGLTAGAQISSLPTLGIAFDKLGSYDAYPAIYDNNCGGNPTSGTQMLINFGYPCQFQPVGDLVLRPTPGSQILSLGYWNTGGDDTTKLEFFDASNQLLGSITSTSGLSFIGIVSDVGASWVRISEVAGNSIFSIDDLQVGTRTTNLPEPQTPALMLAGLLLAARSRRVRRTAGPTEA